MADLDLEDILNEGSDDDGVGLGRDDLDAILAESDDDDPITTPIIERRESKADKRQLLEVDEEIKDAPSLAPVKERDESEKATPKQASVPQIDSHSRDEDILADILAEEDDELPLPSGEVDVDTLLSKMEQEDMLAKQGELGATTMMFRTKSGLLEAEESESKLAASANYKMIAPLRGNIALISSDAAGGILKTNNLETLTDQLKSDIMSRETGLLMCCSIHPKFIAIGTSRGHVIVFTHMQTIHKILGNASSNYGQVCCVHISPNGMTLVAGHEKGTVVLWDLNQDSPMTVITDGHTEAVAHVCLLDDRWFVTADIKGNVMQFNYSKVLLMSRVSRSKILDGAVVSGSILAMNPLSTTENAVSQFNLIAMCSSEMIFVISTTPDVRVCYKSKRFDGIRQGAIPYLSWFKGDRETPAVLAVGWGRNIRLFQVSVLAQSSSESSLSKIDLSAGICVDCETEVTGLQWLSESVLAYLNAKDQIRIMDPYSNAELEVVSVKDFGLVYHTRFSESLGSLREQAFHYSFCSCDSKLYLLGDRRLQCNELLSWSGRIQALVDKNEWLPALSLSLDFYEGRAKAVVGLPADKKSLRAKTGSKVAELLTQYLERAMKRESSAGASSGVTDEVYYQTIAGVCIDYCITIERTDMLFGEIFAQFEAVNMRGVFLEMLEPYILNDKLMHLNPRIMQCFVDHYRSNRLLRRVEQCILHMDISSLDFDQVVKLCRKHHLYSALIYIHNKGMEDYITPLEELMGVVSGATPFTDPSGSTSAQQAEEGRQAAAYKLLLYLKYCLSGRSFPRGQIPVKQLGKVKRSVLEYLFISELEDEPGTKYPRLRPLLMADTRELLAVLNEAYAGDFNAAMRAIAIAKQTEKLDGAGSTARSESTQPSAVSEPRRSMAEDGASEKGSELSATAAAEAALEAAQKREEAEARRREEERAKSRGSDSVSLQLIVDALILLVVDPIIEPFKAETERKGWPFSAEQQSYVLQFAAQWLVARLVVLEPGIVRRILSALCLHHRDDELKSREELVLSIINDANLMKMAEVNLEKLLPIADKAGFLEVSETMYRKQAKHGKIVECYLHDATRKTKIFNFLETVLREPGAREEVRVAVMDNFKEIAELDPRATAKVIVSMLPEETEPSIAILEPFPETQYNYLKAIMSMERKLQEGGGSGGGAGGGEEKAAGKVITGEVQETYIKLLCLYNPTEVFPFLSTHDDYRLEHCLAMVRKHNIQDAIAYLLERTGDVFAALNLFMDAIDQRLLKLKTVYEKSLSATEDGTEVLAAASVSESLAMAVSLCRRNSGRLEEKESEQLWFKLLDKFVVPQRNLKKQQNSLRKDQEMPLSIVKMQQGLARFINDILYNMMGYIAFPSILGKIVHDHGSDEFGDFRTTITGMLDTYNYEMNILTTANHLLADDTYQAMRVLYKRRVKALIPKANSCALCNLPLLRSAGDEKSQEATLFQCSHIFHADCLGKNKNCLICSKNTVKASKKHKDGHEEKAHKEDKEKSSTAITAAQRREMRRYLARIERAEKKEKMRELQSRYKVFSDLGKGADFDGVHRPILSVRPPVLILPTEQLVGQRYPEAMDKDPQAWMEIGDEDLWVEVNNASAQ